MERPYPAVLLHMETATLVELDSMLHFSSPRLLTLDLYPHEVKLGFDIDEYKELCREYAPKTDRWRYGLASKCFGFHGLQNERAYYDAIRDIASWVMGFPPLFRMPAIDEDGEAAYERSKASSRSDSAAEGPRARGEGGGEPATSDRCPRCDGAVGCGIATGACWCASVTLSLSARAARGGVRRLPVPGMPARARAVPR